MIEVLNNQTAEIFEKVKKSSFEIVISSNEELPVNKRDMCQQQIAMAALNEKILREWKEDKKKVKKHERSKS